MTVIKGISNDNPYKANAEETLGAYSLMEVVTQPGEGPRVHTHTKEDEGFYVLEGIYRFWLGDQPPVDIGPGGHVFGPRNIPHRFRCISRTKPGKMLLILTPGGFEGYFREMAAVRQAGGADLLDREEAIDAKYGLIMDRRSEDRTAELVARFRNLETQIMKIFGRANCLDRHCGGEELRQASHLLIKEGFDLEEVVDELKRQIGFSSFSHLGYGVEVTSEGIFVQGCCASVTALLDALWNMVVLKKL